MKTLIREHLARFFDLPAELITDEADLYVLSILSMYFKEEQAARDKIRIPDIDVEKLCLSRNDLHMDEEGSRLDIYLDELLRKDLSAQLRDKACFNDHIGRDGFSKNLLETVLCVMEISGTFNCDFTEFPDDDERSSTVKDLMDFVLKRNSQVIKN